MMCCEEIAKSDSDLHACGLRRTLSFRVNEVGCACVPTLRRLEQLSGQTI